MEHSCLDARHEERLGALMEKDKIRGCDMERTSLFYIMAGSDELYARHNALYDFDEHGIKPEALSGCEDFSSGTRAMVRLGFNLYNGYRDNDMSPLDLFWNLDSRNKQVARNALGLRFG